MSCIAFLIIDQQPKWVSCITSLIYPNDSLGYATIYQIKYRDTL